MFARPLTGVDYVLAKVGAIFAILFAFSFLPQVVLFVGQMLVSDSVARLRRATTSRCSGRCPLAVAVLALFYAVVGLAIASLTDRRIIAGAAIIGLLLVTSITAGILVGEDDFGINDGSPAALINVLALPLYLRDVIFLGNVDPESPLAGVSYGGLLRCAAYVAVVLVAAAVLLRRYRWVER